MKAGSKVNLATSTTDSSSCSTFTAEMIGVCSCKASSECAGGALTGIHERPSVETKRCHQRRCPSYCGQVEWLLTPVRSHLSIMKAGSKINLATSTTDSSSCSTFSAEMIGACSCKASSECAGGALTGIRGWPSVETKRCHPRRDGLCEPPVQDCMYPHGVQSFQLDVQTRCSSAQWRS